MIDHRLSTRAIFFLLVASPEHCAGLRRLLFRRTCWATQATSSERAQTRRTVVAGPAAFKSSCRTVAHQRHRAAKKRRQQHRQIQCAGAADNQAPALGTRPSSRYEMTSLIALSPMPGRRSRDLVSTRMTSYQKGARLSGCLRAGNPQRDLPCFHLSAWQGHNANAGHRPAPCGQLPHIKRGNAEATCLLVRSAYLAAKHAKPAPSSFG